MPFYHLYYEMWAKNPGEAMDLTTKALINPAIDFNEKYTARDVAYSSGRDEFLEWFKDAATSMTTSADSDELLLWYRSSVSDSDQKWLNGHKNFQPFHELALRRIKKDGDSYSTPDVVVAVDER